MTLDSQIKDVKKVLRKSPQTAGEIADKAGYGSGRAISRALAKAVANGDATLVSQRPAKYIKV